MAQVGDTVRYLSSTGGGVITKIDGKIAYVEEDGFETPVLLKELVVVLPAGHKGQSNGAALMFDQKAFDKGRSASGPAEKPVKLQEAPHSKDAGESRQSEPAVETEYGDRLSVSLAFEPTDLRRLSESAFNAVLVNDSNYTLKFVFSGRDADAKGWRVIYAGDVEPNELIDLASFTHGTLSRIERVALQGVAYKAGKEYGLQSPVDASRRLDLTKFHKLHCFRPGRYFDYPVLEFPLLSDGRKAQAVTSSQGGENEHDAGPEEAYAKSLEKLKGAFSAQKGEGRKNGFVKSPSDNPNRLLPLIEVDLHASELVDSLAGMSNSDILEMQLDRVRATMNEHRRRIGQKIVFIHGKGEGVLRKAVLTLLKKEFPACELQDASFREYGFGATLVTIHSPKQSASTSES